MFSSIAATAFNSLTLNQACKQIHKQANMCCVQVLPCVGLCAYAQMHISRVGKQQCTANFMAMKNHTTLNSAQACATARCGMDTFLTHA